MEKLHKDEWQALMRILTARSINNLTQVSQLTKVAADAHNKRLAELPSKAYLADLFCCEYEEIENIIKAICNFVNHYIDDAKLTETDLTKKLHFKIINKVHAHTTREVLEKLNLNQKVLGSQSLLRSNATHGIPDIKYFEVQNKHIPIALTLLSITLSLITPIKPDKGTQQAIEYWIVYKIYHNKEAKRLSIATNDVIGNLKNLAQTVSQSQPAQKL